MIQPRRVKGTAGQRGPVKGGPADPADLEGTVGEMGKVAVRTLRETVKGHAVKIALPKKIQGEACLGRPVIESLVNDFQGPVPAVVTGEAG